MYESAIKILNILENNGYKAYIVGAKLRKIEKICKHFREYLRDVCKS